ncbi:MAG: hypothetical protein R2706_04435 [Acidimicrobiales bacterium]
MKSLLLGESAGEEIWRPSPARSSARPTSRASFTSEPSTSRPEELLVGTKVAFDRGLSVAELAKAIDVVEAEVRAVMPIARPIYIEPDLLRTQTPEP